MGPHLEEPGKDWEEVGEPGWGRHMSYLTTHRTGPRHGAETGAREGLLGGEGLRRRQEGALGGGKLTLTKNCF